VDEAFRHRLKSFFYNVLRHGFGCPVEKLWRRLERFQLDSRLQAVTIGGPDAIPDNLKTVCRDRGSGEKFDYLAGDGLKAGAFLEGSDKRFQVHRALLIQRNAHFFGVVPQNENQEPTEFFFLRGPGSGPVLGARRVFFILTMLGQHSAVSFPAFDASRCTIIRHYSAPNCK